MFVIGKVFVWLRFLLGCFAVDVQVLRFPLDERWVLNLKSWLRCRQGDTYKIACTVRLCLSTTLPIRYSNCQANGYLSWPGRPGQPNRLPTSKADHWTTNRRPKTQSYATCNPGKPFPTTTYILITYNISQHHEQTQV